MQLRGKHAYSLLLIKAIAVRIKEFILFPIPVILDLQTNKPARWLKQIQ